MPCLAPCPSPVVNVDLPRLTRRLSQLESTCVKQAAEAARINERAENARTHYNEVMRAFPRGSSYAATASSATLHDSVFFRLLSLHRSAFSGSFTFGEMW